MVDNPYAKYNNSQESLPIKTHILEKLKHTQAW